MSTFYLVMPGTLLRTGDVLDNPPNVGQGRGAPPIVTVDTTGMTGVPLRVFGTDGRTSWWVRGARGGHVIDRTVYHLADPLAPVNVPVIYYLVDDDGTETQITQTVRGFAARAGEHLITDLDGLVGVTVFRYPDGDQRAPELRSERFSIPGRGSAVARWDRSMEGSVSMQVSTTGQDTALLRRMVGSGAPLIFLHNQHRCGLPGCDVPGAQVGILTAAPSQLSRRSDLAERTWDLGFDVMDDPHADLFAVVSTVDMFDAAHVGDTIADFDADYAGMTLADFDQQVWA